jgi:type II secretory pathway pseudopilin PulG
MSLLFPAVNSAIDAAKKAQAKNDAVQIATAVIAYETEYGKLPGLTGLSDTSIKAAGSVSVDADIITILGNLKNNNTNNPRGITFLEVQNAKRGKSGLTNNEFVDPWGAVYMIALDGDYNNKLDVGLGISPGPTASSGDIRKRVAVWNDVTKQSNSTDAQKKRRAVVSWE